MATKRKTYLTLIEYEAYLAVAQLASLMAAMRTSQLTMPEQLAQRLNIAPVKAQDLITAIQSAARKCKVEPTRRCVAMLRELGCLRPGDKSLDMLRSRAVNSLLYAFQRSIHRLPEESRSEILSHCTYDLTRKFLDITPSTIRHALFEPFKNQTSERHRIVSFIAESIDIGFLTTLFEANEMTGQLLTVTSNGEYCTFGGGKLPKVGVDVAKQIASLCYDLGMGSMLDPKVRESFPPEPKMEIAFETAARILHAHQFKAHEAGDVLDNGGLDAVTKVYEPKEPVKPAATPERIQEARKVLGLYMRPALITRVLRAKSTDA